MKKLSFNVLTQNSFWILNKHLVKILGIEATLFLSDLISKQAYFKDKNELDNQGFFFNTSKNIEQDTTLSYPKQIRARKILVEYNILIVKNGKKLNRTHFRIDEYILQELLGVDKNLEQYSPESIENTEFNENGIVASQNHKTSIPENGKLNINNNKKNNNKNNIILARVRKPNKKIKIKDFSNFCKIYPLEIKIDKALKAWVKLCNLQDKDIRKPTFVQIKKAIHYQKKTKQWQDVKYIKYPGNWLESFGWLSEAESMDYDWDKINANKPELKEDPNPFNTMKPEEMGAYFRKQIQEQTRNWRETGEKPSQLIANAGIPHNRELNEEAEKAYNEEMIKWEEWRKTQFYDD